MADARREPEDRALLEVLVEARLLAAVLPRESRDRETIETLIRELEAAPPSREPRSADRDDDVADR